MVMFSSSTKNDTGRLPLLLLLPLPNGTLEELRLLSSCWATEGLFKRSILIMCWAMASILTACVVSIHAMETQDGVIDTGCRTNYTYTGVSQHPQTNQTRPTVPVQSNHSAIYKHSLLQTSTTIQIQFKRQLQGGPNMADLCLEFTTEPPRPTPSQLYSQGIK